MPRLSTPLLALQCFLLGLSFASAPDDPMRLVLTLSSLFVCGLNFGIAWCKKHLERRW